ncbi:MAG: hypothetical protein A3G81_30675 [Betaproteobacteria bacterium RIFCSPLOWO2_12_FULL_65_14]|nr:MAG: hypothetical protein A3I02_05015 [Betaproteobacteria bacterium RIFCSPLOWO2_02_FULL_67_26]OGA71249.1 MAG: hypothetical protein A3G81_30675 [Betaproteobacteria bacterium RIFCSPLOWO2_12_FULL_65_14]
MTLLVIGALIATVVALFNGVASMAHGGVEDDRASYGLMCKRCLWQAVAVALVLVAMLGQLA